MGNSMLKLTNRYLLLVVIITFAFVYRLFLMFGNTFPPGADIGLHNSVIYSITQGGNTDFLYNFYQMGGGLSLTFPGYHIFTSAAMLMTGMPDYIAQAVVVSFFSAFISLGAFLITRSVWNESAAFIVAFLVAVSRFDIEMLMWAGYPNAVALFLIPLAFYLFLHRERFSNVPFIVASAFVAASIFLTHSLSAIMFLSITFVTAFFVLVAPKIFGSSRKTIFYWLLSLVFGAVLVSPFLAEAVPAYLFSNSTLAGTPDSKLALLSTRVLPLEIVLPLFLITIAFFLFSKQYSGRFLSLPTLLLVVWLVVPLAFTQGYLVGLVVDYNRFLYFVILPVLVFVGLLIEHGATFFAHVINTYHVLTSQAQTVKKTSNKTVQWLSTHLTRKALYSIFIVSFMLFAFLAVPIFVTPTAGQAIENYYQTMTEPGYEAINWAKQNTPSNALFVSDALYGWWFGGFAQRPTISAVDPQYLTLNREYEPAKFAKNLLDTDYVIDNGYIQVREDGGYLGRHNPMILADVNWTYFPFAFYQFNSSEINLRYRNAGTVQSSDVTQIPVIDMKLVNETDSASIIVSKANNLFNYTETLTLPNGVSFVNMTIQIQTKDPNVTLDWIDFYLDSQGVFKQPIGNTVAMVDTGAKECGQLIFAKTQPQNVTSIISSNPCLTDLTYNLQGQSSAEIQILIGLYPISESDASSQLSLNKLLQEKAASAQQPKEVLPRFTFDYNVGVQKFDVSYVAIRTFELNPKFASDPAFSLVFINDEVAIFKVKGNLS